MAAPKNKIKSEQERKRKRLLSSLGLDFSISREKVVNLFLFIAFLAFWAVLFIANRHYAEKTEREISRLNDEVEDLRADYLTTKQELMFETKQTEIANRVEILGLEELKEPPEKIEIAE